MLIRILSFLATITLAVATVLAGSFRSDGVRLPSADQGRNQSGTPESSMSVRAALTSTALALACAAVLPAGDDWPQYRGPNADGISPAKGLFANLKDGPVAVWKAQVGTGSSSVVIADGVAYTSGNVKDVDSLFAFEAATGKPLAGWTNYAFPEKLDPNYYEGGPNASPTVAGGVVYGLSRSGRAYAVDAKTGKEKWAVDLAAQTGAKPPTWGFTSSPRLIDGRILVSVGRTGTALDPATGAVLWKSGPEPAGYASVVTAQVGGAPHLLIFSSKSVSLVAPADGKVAWEMPWLSQYDTNASDPIVAGSQAFFGSNGEKGNLGCGVYEITATEAKPVWTAKTMRTKLSPAVKIGDHLYGIDLDKLSCVAWKTGEKTWEKPGFGSGSLVAAEGKLVVLTEKVELVIVDANPAAYTEAIRGQVIAGKSWTPPAIANGLVYIRNTKGAVAAVALR